MTQPDWIAVDWGTTHLRAYAMKSDQMLGTKTSDKGMSKLAPNQFEDALLELIQPWRTGQTDVIACGMIGAKEGWQDAGYQAVPCRPLQNTITVEPSDPNLSVTIVSGLSQSAPPDVMRGEETQIAGFLHYNPTFDGVICLPGTHTKWVRISAEEVVSFVTFMTGEIFHLVAEKSVLSNSVGSEQLDHDDFLDAVSDAISKPQHFASRLFGLRAASLLSDLSPAKARARLSGTLIGTELAAARPYWLGQQIALIGTPDLNALYDAALTAQGAAPIQANGPEMTVAGLIAARKGLAA